MTEDSVGEKIMERYRLLCREALSPLTQTRGNPAARCYYQSNSPQSTLRPEKVEMYHDNPRIMMIHDVVTTDQARRLLGLSSDKMVG